MNTKPTNGPVKTIVTLESLHHSTLFRAYKSDEKLRKVLKIPKGIFENGSKEHKLSGIRSDIIYFDKQLTDIIENIQINSFDISKKQIIIAGLIKLREAIDLMISVSEVYSKKIRLKDSPVEA